MLQHFQQKSLQKDDIIESSANKFRVIKQISQGGSGEVFLVQNLKNNVLYAMKLQSFIDQDEQQICQEFSKHRFRYIVNIIDFFQLQRKVCLIMEYAELGDLRDLMQSSKLDQDQVKDIIRDCLYGIQELHNLNYIHRDIKPENILLFQDDQNNNKNIIYKLCDLGLLKNENLACTMNIGTPNYMAPEQIFEKNQNYLITQSTQILEKSIDIWALGCIWYELIAQTHLFDESYSLKEIFNSILNIKQEQIDQKIDELNIEQRDKQILKNFLQKKADKRFTVQEAIETLNGATKYIDKMVMSIKPIKNPIKIISKKQEISIQPKKIQLISQPVPNNVKDIRLKTLEQFIIRLTTQIDDHQRIIEYRNDIQDYLQNIPQNFKEWYVQQLIEIKDKQDNLQKCQLLINQSNQQIFTNKEFQECQRSYNQIINKYQEEQILKNKQEYINQMKEDIEQKYQNLKYQNKQQFQNQIEHIIQSTKEQLQRDFIEYQSTIEEKCKISQEQKIQEIQLINCIIDKDYLNTLFNNFQAYKKLHQLIQFNNDIDQFCCQFKPNLIETIQYKPNHKQKYDHNQKILMKYLKNQFLVSKNAQLADQNKKSEVSKNCIQTYDKLIINVNV